MRLKQLHIRYSALLGTVLLLACFQQAVAQQNTEQMASYYYQNKEYDKAIELYKPLYQRTQNKFYYQVLYESYLALEQYKEAERLVEKRIRLDGRDLTLYVDLGNLYQKKEERKKAEKSFDEAIGRIGYDAKQLSDLALAFQNVGRSDCAIKAYKTARQKMNAPYSYVMELAALYEHQGDYESMMQEYFNLLDHIPNYLNNVQISLQRSLHETSNPQLAEGLRRALVARIQRQPNNRTYLEMMIWFSLQNNDFQFAWTQAKAVDARFPGQGEEQVFRVAQIAHNNGDYATALECYGYLVKKGPEGSFYFDSRVGELKVKFDRLNKAYGLSKQDLSTLRKEYENAFAELGKTVQTIPLMRNYAYLLAYCANDVQEAADVLYDIVEMPKVPRNTLNEVKLELGDLLLFAGSIWDASLLYSQVEKANKDDVIGAMAKFKNAKLSYYNNDFQWAKSQLDVLRASTSKLIANDAMELSLLISDNMEVDSTYDLLEMYAAADLMLYRNQLDSAWDGFDAVTKRAMSHPLFDEVLMQKAKIRMKQGRYSDADSLLQKLVDFYPTDILADDALFMLAELNENKLNNKERARGCYEKLILDYPASLYVEQSRKRYNELKKQ